MTRELGFGKYRFDLQLWVIFIVNVVAAVGFGVVFPFIAIYLAQTGNHGLGLGDLATGVIMMSYMAIGTVFMLIGGAWADRYGRKRIMMISAVGEGGLLCLYALAGEFWGFLAIALAEGAVGSLYQPAAGAMIADMVPPERRPEAFSLLRIGFNSGMAVGPLLGGLLLMALDFRSMFIISGIMVGIAGLFIILWTKETLNIKPGDEFRYRDIKKAAKDRVFMGFCVMIAITFFIYAQLISSLPNYSTAPQDLGIPTTSYSIVFAIMGAMVVFLQIPVTWVAVKARRSTAMGAGQLIMSLGLGAIFLVRDLTGVILAVAFFTLGELIYSAVYTTVVADMAPERLRGTYMGVSGLVFGIGDSLGMFSGMALLSVLTMREYTWIVLMVIGIPAAIGYFALRRYLSKKVDMGTIEEKVEPPMEPPVHEAH
jgi:MFS family permease